MKKKLLAMILLVTVLSILFVGCSLGQKKVVRIDVGETLPRQFELGSTPDFSGVSATIVYNDSTTKEVSSSELEFGSVDTTKTGKQTLTVTYEGFTQNFEVEVKKNTDNTPVRELLSIEYQSGIPSAVYTGDALLYANIVLKAKFSDNTEESITVGANSNVKYNTIDMNTAGKQTITFTYMNKTCNVEVDVQAIKVVKIEVDYDSISDGINADTIKVSKLFNNGTFTFIDNEDITITQDGDIYTVTYVDAKHGTFTATIDAAANKILESIEIISTGYEDFIFLVGDSFSPNTIHCKAHYTNGATANLDRADFTVSFSTETAGENTLTVTYNENEDIKATVKILVREIQTVRIDTATFKTKIAAGSTIDKSLVKLSITCTDGTTVTRNAQSVDLTNLDLDAPNDTSYVTATYNGVVSEKLNVYVIDPSTDIFIFGAELPDALTSIENKKNLFKNKNYGYYVGDDNPFILKLIVTAIDENDEEVPTEDIVFKSYYELYLDGVQLTDSLDTYVKIDVANHSLDFTEAAIGKTFKIVVCPEGRETLSSNIDVTVVNGYNIYEAWELNYLTNINDFADSTDYGVNVNQLTFVDEFLAGKNVTEANRPKNLAGIVLHGDLTIKPTDLPRQYFLGEDYTQEFWDNITIFPHATDSADNTFTFYGNYFTVHTHMLPTVCKLGTGNQNGVEMPTGVAVSNAQLFRFTSMAGIIEKSEINNTAEDINFNVEDYNATIKDLYLRDDNPNSNDEWKAERALRGLIAMKVCYQVVNLDNVRLEAFYVGAFLDYDYVTLNVNDSIFYNAYQNHIYIWCENHLLDNDDALPGDNHHASIVNVTSSVLTKCGGPVFLSQSQDTVHPNNSKSAPYVTVSADSEIWSFVTGEEVWFSIIGQTAAVKQIIGLGEYFGSPYVPTNGKSFTTQVGEVENLQGKFINLIMINLDSGFGGNDVDGTFSIADGETTTSYLNMNDINGSYGNSDVSNYIGNYGIYCPVIETATGGVLAYTGDTSSGPPHVATNPDKLTDGDYIAFYNLGMGIVLGYNINDQIERLPANP